MQASTKRDSGRPIVLIVVIASVLGLGLIGVSIWKLVEVIERAASGPPNAPKVTPANYFEDSMAVADHIRAEFGADVRLLHLHFSSSDLEIIIDHDSEPERHMRTPNGSWLKRGGPTVDAGEPFTLAQLQLAQVPAMLTDAREVSKLTVFYIEVVREPGSALFWRLKVSNGGAGTALSYAADGTPLPVDQSALTRAQNEKHVPTEADFE